MNNNYSVGSFIPKVDGMQLVTGKPVYTDDIAPKDSLIIKILRSPYAFAKIKSINKEKAEKIPGVECILTHEDLPKKLFTRAGQSYPEPSTYDKYILDEYVRYIGDEVAIVAAVSEDIALKALKLIKVEYEVYEPVLDMEQAETHPSKIHFRDKCHSNINIGFDPEKNIAAVYNFGYGKVDEVLEKCDVVVKGTYRSQAQAHAMMETYRAFSYIDQYGKLVIVSSTQIPFHVRRMVANALDLPISKVRVIKPRIGGGFGGKQTAQVEFYTAAVTLKTGKPSKIIYTRKETFESTTTRQPMKISVTIGADKDGNIKAIDMEALSDTGAYGEHAYTVLGAAGYKTLPLYNKAEAARFRGKAVYTNRTPGGALRGYGVTQGTFALESAINELAHKLNMDPTELREKNMLRKGETSEIFNMTTVGAGIEPIIMNSCELEYCVKRGKDLIDWDNKYPRREISPNRIRGIGMSIAMQGSGIPGIDTATATIKLEDNGCFTLLLGATDIGTGSDTILRQIAAEALGVENETISVYSSDTDLTPFDVGAYASGTTYFSGNAVKKAAIKMKELIEQEGARHLKLNVEDVIFDGKEIRNKSGDERVSLADLSNRLIYKNPTNQLTSTASFGTSDVAPPFVSGFAEVEVDIETGKVELINYVTVVDSGTIINPTLARIQTEGGVVQGIGMALFEEVREDSRGRMITNELMEYKIPSRLDINNIIVDFAESYEPTGPFGAKSIGEVVTNTPCPAIADAIYNAVGVRVRDLPITPEKVKMLLKNQNQC
ncbi:aldehyde oxidase and xanthine dehydrogenase, molybdopterin binding [Proteiniborus sp. DW1]|uniref:xanthine dehydrogenase family protein molybdopterin-binding subunit n=1 Tax=Proteiniborus sp. DW1 TaxID=1889883 RepID=UPI00092E0FD4|nr:molybdopterin cofactor-binding domain-containing protein [Proteiniborus sp. DW1]SCG81686.1 aldehyde oxidase and xanthine dehydrogenase, molybdopterin binding [Proteiniborus sp. DW1]